MCSLCKTGYNDLIKDVDNKNEIDKERIKILKLFYKKQGEKFILMVSYMILMKIIDVENAKLI